ncbi:MAG: flagellin [Cognatishimia sp.]
MSSILTNHSAMNALQTLNMVNKGLNQTQDRVSTGLQIASGKDNAAYFAISETMKGDSGMLKAINEGLTSTKNSVSTARLGAETVKDLANQFSERVAFAQGGGIDLTEVQAELDGFVDRIDAAITQATFNGENLVEGTATQTAVTGITRSATASDFEVTTVSFDEVDLRAIHAALDAIDISGGVTTTDLQTSETQLGNAISAATSLGVTEKTLEGQQEFLSALTDTLDTGVSAMVDADMEEEAARLQAYQVQQQLATQSLSIANQAPQNIMSLFR